MASAARVLARHAPLEDPHDRRLVARPPALPRVTRREQDQRVRVLRGELTPERRRRPVDRRDESVHDRAEVLAAFANRRRPEQVVVGVREHLEHVVATAAEEMLERELQRCRSSSPHACPYHP